MSAYTAFKIVHHLLNWSEGVLVGRSLQMYAAIRRVKTQQAKYDLSAKCHPIFVNREAVLSREGIEMDSLLSLSLETSLPTHRHPGSKYFSVAFSGSSPKRI
jgi:hypothetical protein